ncbi:unnamed protein product [Cylicocyclus nassatus]|uniref:G-protein coupled receptors family 1 profile domain-containing protein n=1 Tax=Cylicocyclus nassatus TaxID=53992 RepID=A0AA36DJI5_CYLNA|nr:unnamed protein product [Cylicocyclus nassatus]
MRVEVLLYILNIILNAAIVLLDILLIYIILSGKDLRKNPVIMLVFMAMLLDVCVFLNTIAHDVPSYILQKDITTTLTTEAATVLLSVQWFFQLFLLPVLSVIHLLAVFAPLNFRRISRKDTLVCIIVILLISASMTAPLFTSCCGYAYFIPGHYWHFDFAKPYTYIYNDVNIVLQVTCVGIMLVIDILIVYKVYKLQSAHSQVVNASIATIGHSTTTRKKSLKLSPETRLALSFVALTVCFLTSTLCFNLIKTNGFWQDAAMKVSANLNLIKWALYSLGNSGVRNRLWCVFRAWKPSGSTQHSLFTKTQLSLL